MLKVKNMAKEIINKKKQELELNLLRIIDEEQKMSQRGLAKKAGVSLGAVNYCLRALAERGWVKFENFSHSSNKPGYLYVLSPSGIKKKTELTVGFLKTKLTEYYALQQEIEKLRSEIESASPELEDK